MKITLAMLATLLTLATPVCATPKTITLSVPTMNCSACPITVKKALHKVSGVSAAKVDFDKREATVMFDGAKTNVAALMRATTEAGYPSTLAGSVQ